MNAGSDKDNTDSPKYLIKCVSSCTTISGTDGGYYINAATANAIISCDASGCVEKTDTTNDVGYYINEDGRDSTTFTKLISCNKDTDDNTKIKCDNVNNPSGYYLNKANTKEAIYCNTNGCVEKAEDTDAGYYLNEDEKTGTTYKYLIQCKVDNREMSCDNVTSPNGYYINKGNENEIIYCDTTGCIEKAEASDAGVYGDADEASGTPTTYTKIIQCKANTESGESPITCTSNATPEGYFINQPSKNSDNKYTELLYCVSSDNDPKTYSCSILTGSTDTKIPLGFIIDSGSKNSDGDFTKLIQCEGEGTEITCSSFTPEKEGYYIDGSDGKNIINCTGTGDAKVCSSITHGTASNKQQHYLDATTNRVISCTETDCFLEDPTINGYFINSGTINSGKNVIICGNSGQGETSPCKEDTGTTTAPDKIGEVQFDTDKLVLCTGTTCSTDKSETGTDAYITITNKNEKFPGATTDKDISVKVGADGSIILLEPAELPTCNAITGSVACVSGHPEQYCIKDNKIYKTTSTTSAEGQTTLTCGAITSTDGELLFFNTENENIDIPSLGDNTSITTLNVKAYQCTGTGDNLSCELVKGYVITSGDDPTAIQCSGWKREGCTITKINSDSSCPSSPKGNLLGDGTGICFSTTTPLTLPASGFVAFQVVDTNSLYGQDKNAIVFLKLTSSSVLVTSPTGKEYNYRKMTFFIYFFSKFFNYVGWNSYTFMKINNLK